MKHMAGNLGVDLLLIDTGKEHLQWFWLSPANEELQATSTMALD
jgi:hypothetical protein